MGCYSSRVHVPPAPHINKCINTQLHSALTEMRTLRKVHAKQKEDKKDLIEGNATQCQECYGIMPHITTRTCTCHEQDCSRYKSTKSCTIFRRISKLDSTGSNKT
jgi:hypothetical protein